MPRFEVLLADFSLLLRRGTPGRQDCDADEDVSRGDLGDIVCCPLDSPPTQSLVTLVAPQ